MSAVRPAAMETPRRCTALRALLCAVLVPLWGAACQSAAPPPAQQTGPADTGTGTGAAPTPADPSDEVLLNRVGALDRQELKEGECALFLWAALPQRRLVLFQRADVPSAEMRIDGVLVTLNRSRAEGEPLFGIFPDQSLAEGRISVTLSITRERLQTITKGAVVRQASLNVSDASGWSVITPVAGLISCQ